MINDILKDYIELNIFPLYENNDSGHGIDHIKYVIDRSIKFAKSVDNINYDMVYTIAAYHDIAHHINRKEHEKISSEILFNDDNLKKFFNEEEICLMRDAVYDHRASMDGEPRSIYGKIVSSADRNTSIDDILRRTYSYRISNFPNSSLNEIISESLEHIKNKFGDMGYASDKMYFDDEEYETFLNDIKELICNKDLFTEKYLSVNNLNDLFKLNE